MAIGASGTTSGVTLSGVAPAVALAGSLPKVLDRSGPVRFTVGAGLPATVVPMKVPVPALSGVNA